MEVETVFCRGEPRPQSPMERRFTSGVGAGAVAVEVVRVAQPVERRSKTAVVSRRCMGVLW
jgi:hypothetical protein